MFVSLRTITLPPERLSHRDPLTSTLRAAALALPGLRGCWVAPVSPKAVINAGHIVWRMTFDTEAAAAAARLSPGWTAIAALLAGTEITSVGYHASRGAVRPAGKGIWRALIFRVMPQGFPDAARTLEEQLMLMPAYIREIRSWSLSPIATVEGPKAFTHVWEQEFDDLADLTGPYMQHPLHWGVVDAWFDAEYPQYVVDPHVVQVVGEISETIMPPMPGEPR